MKAEAVTPKSSSWVAAITAAQLSHKVDYLPLRRAPDATFDATFSAMWARIEPAKLLILLVSPMGFEPMTP
jgi:hypothetical protein